MLIWSSSIGQRGFLTINLMKKLSHQFDKPKRSVASPEALEALRNNNAVRWYVLSLPDCHRGGVRGLQREQDRRIQAGEPSFGFFGVNVTI